MAEYRQKQEEADWEFRRGLEELVRGHIDGCMSAALASCSSAARGGDEDDDGAAADGSDQLARRRRRSDLEGDDLAESSAAARRHSRILSRWVARQAEEMITTIERRNRESELMALAGLHTVSMLDSSFLREPRRSSSAAQQQQQQSVAVERPVAAARASSLLQRWRELEDAASARERRNAAASAASNRTRPESRAEERQAGSSEDASESDNEFAQWARGQLNTTGRRDVEEEDNDRRLSREQSPDAGDIERERVRQIVRGWMTESAMTDADSRISPRTESPRAEWLGETERERVRLVREWVQMASQHRDARSGRREEGERERERDGSVTDHEEGPPEHARRDRLRLRGRQARLDLIMRIVRERERELQGLLEHRAVSDFPHRNRIQSLLRGRFLRNGRPPEEERVPSAAARELGQLRQRHTVSGLRLENIVRGQASSQVQANIQVQGNNNSSNLVSRDITGSRSESSRSVAVVEQANDNHEQPHVRGENIEIPQTTETHTPAESESNIPNDDLGWQESNLPGENWEADDGRRDWQQAPDVEFSEWHDGAQEGSDGNWQENMDQEWSREEPEDEDGEDSQILEMHEEWHENASHETVETWPEGLSDPPRDQRSIPSRRFNRFIPPDDENVYSMELRELLSRRSVSTLLRSGFRESLDQLIQSYVQRQGRAPFDWDLERTLPTPAPPEDDQGQQRDDMNQDQQDSIARAPLVMPSSPVPPPQPLWPSDLHHTSWTRQSMHRTEIEWDIINDLRADMARLQQGMSHMQRMLEACMDMQLELQRSVRQEVSAALNRSVGGQDVSEQPSEDGSKWSHVRKGTCCVCCDNHIDSLLYRCGHMCTCSKCANELVRVGGKCPLCRAPIVEVIRAYCIL